MSYEEIVQPDRVVGDRMQEEPTRVRINNVLERYEEMRRIRKLNYRYFGDRDLINYLDDSRSGIIVTLHPEVMRTGRRMCSCRLQTIRRGRLSRVLLGSQ